MKIFLLLLAATSVAFALTLPPATPDFDTERSLVERGRSPGAVRPANRPHPEPVTFQLGNGNHDVPSVHEVANTEPKWSYPKAPFTTRQGIGKPAVGDTVFTRPAEGPGLLGNLYLGEDNSRFARGLRLTEARNKATRDRQFTIPSNGPTRYDRARAIGLQEFKQAQAEFGMHPHVPSTWKTDKGWWQGYAVDLQDSAAVDRRWMLSEVSRTLQTWKEGGRIQLHDNTQTLQNWPDTPPSDPLPNWARTLGPPGGPSLPPRAVDGGPLGRTLLDNSAAGNLKPREVSKLKRQNPISQITNQESGAAAGVTNDTNAFSADFQTYLAAFNVAQSNVSNLIFPFLDSILNGTNSSIVYDTAWSIYSDLTGSSPVIIGPFMYGMHSLDWIEDQIFGNSTNSTVSHEDKYAKNEILAFHSVLLDLYNYAWSNGTAAINQTGLLEDMTMLSQYMMPNDTSIMGSYANYTSPAYDASYFTTYNQTLLPDSAYGNVTS